MITTVSVYRLAYKDSLLLALLLGLFPYVDYYQQHQVNFPQLREGNYNKYLLEVVNGENLFLLPTMVDKTNSHWRQFCLQFTIQNFYGSGFIGT